MQQLLQSIREQLRGSYPDPEIRSLSYRIVESVCQADKQTLLRGKDKQLSANDLAQIQKITEELKKFRPLAYILGETEFYGLPFHVNEQVLIPRPETEELVEWVLQDTKARGQAAQCRILDVGTGSGCIAIALAKHLPGAEVYALDISEEALKVAEENARIHKVKVQFFQYDILSSLSVQNVRFAGQNVRFIGQNIQFSGEGTSSFFDLIVSNPPYITPSEQPAMSPNVLNCEPHQALFTPENQPMLFYERIADLGRFYLKPGGRIFFEINALFGVEVAAVLQRKGYEDVEVRRDISGKDRMVNGRNIK